MLDARTADQLLKRCHERLLARAGGPLAGIGAPGRPGATKATADDARQASGAACPASDVATEGADAPSGTVRYVVPMRGVQSVVRIVEVGGVARAVARIYSPGEAQAVAHRRAADALVERHGLPAPRLLAVYDREPRVGFVTVEEFVEGEHPDVAAEGTGDSPGAEGRMGPMGPIGRMGPMGPIGPIGLKSPMRPIGPIVSPGSASSGPPLGGGSGDEQLHALAEAFARLHGVVGDACGPIGDALPERSCAWGRGGAGRLRGARSGSARRAFLLAAWNRLWSVWRWGPPEATMARRLAVARWFWRASRRLAGVRSFSLIHDKPNPGNLLWQPAAGRFVLVDLATLCWGLPGKDLAQVLHQVLRDDARATAIFLERYFALRGDLARADYAAFAPLHDAYWSLSQCAIRSRRGRRMGRIAAGDTRAADDWRALTDIVARHPA